MARALSGAGFPVVECDKLGHEAYVHGTATFGEIVRAFGTDVIGVDGEVDRRALGAIVFSDKAKLEQLNAIVWPEIERRMLAQVRALAARARESLEPGEYPVVFVEAAVMLAAGWHRHVHEVWGFCVGEDEAVRRVVARSEGAIPQAVALRRVRAGVPEEELRAAAHVLFRTDSLSVESVVSRATQLAADRRQRGPRALARTVGEIVVGDSDDGAGAGSPSLGAPDAPQAARAQREVEGLGFVRPAAAKAEEVLVVDEHNRVVGHAPRRDMRARNLRHRSSFVFVTSLDGKRVLVQKRAACKDFFPGFLEAAAGGVMVVGEEADATEAAVRELHEEFGIRAVSPATVAAGKGPPGAPNIEFCFWHLHEDAHTRVWGAVYHVAVDPDTTRIRLQEEEVESVEWMAVEDVNASVVAGDPWTPDGVVFWNRFRDFQRARRHAEWTHLALVAVLGSVAVAGISYLAWRRFRTAPSAPSRP